MLPLLRKLYPDRKSYKQETLVKDFLGTEYQAHDVLVDVNVLQLSSMFAVLVSWK